MDDTDRISGLRHPARLRRGRLDRRAGALVARLFATTRLATTRLAPTLAAGLLAVSLGLLAPGSPAWAHNALAEASPEKKATLDEAPTQVKLRFLQKLDPDYTTITVSDASKQKVPSSAPEVKDRTGTIKLEGALANGVYTVAYQVVSTDGHTVKGSYEFTVDDPDAAAPTTSASTAPASAAPASAAPAPAAPGSPAGSAPVTSAEAAPAPAVEEASGNGTLIGVVVAVIVVLAGLAGFLYVRRRKA